MNRRNFLKILPGFLAAKEIAAQLPGKGGAGLYVQLDKPWVSYQQAMLTKKMLTDLQANLWWSNAGLQTLSAAVKDSKTIYNEDQDPQS